MRINEFKDPFSGKKGVYMFTTDHLERLLLFRDEEDFVQGNNTIAFATLVYPVKVLCYALMDNHIHLLVSGRYEDCLAFFAWILHRLARVLEKKHGISGILRARPPTCILNKFFVDYRTVERKIGGSLEFFDRLRRFNLESIVEQEHGIEEKLLFTDTEMQEKIRAVCQNELHTESHHQLERKDLLWLARTLARRFASPKKQIARLLGIDLSILDQLL